MKRTKRNFERAEGKAGERFNKAGQPVRKESQGILEEMPIKKSPDVNKIVDNILLKYNDFGLTDRD